MFTKKLLLPLLLAFSPSVFAQQTSIGKTILLSQGYAVQQAAWINFDDPFNFDDERASLKKGVTLKEIIDELNKRNRTYFMIDSDIGDFPGKTTVKYKNELVSKILRDLAKDFPITYKQVGRVIIIKFRPDIIKSVTCRVIDSTYKPVAGADIYVEHRDNAYKTGLDGTVAVPYLVPGDSLYVDTKNYAAVKGIVKDKTLMIQLTDKFKPMPGVTVHNNGVEKIPDWKATGSFKAVDVNKCSNVNSSPNIIDRLKYSMPVKKNEDPVNGPQPGPIRGSNSFYGNRNGLLTVKI